MNSVLRVHPGNVGLMTTLLQQLRFRNHIPRIFLFGCALALAGLATGALPERVNAQTAVLAASKNICLGDPSTADPSNCQLATQVPVNQPVFYVIKVTNPFGSPPQTISLMENYPNFNPS